jgi:gamma-glutamyl-gamma-aminobutyrate hydrolase PuuD
MTPAATALQAAADRRTEWQHMTPEQRSAEAHRIRLEQAERIAAIAGNTPDAEINIDNRKASK